MSYEPVLLPKFSIKMTWFQQMLNNYVNFQFSKNQTEWNDTYICMSVPTTEKMCSLNVGGKINGTTFHHHFYVKNTDLFLGHNIFITLLWCQNYFNFIFLQFQRFLLLSCSIKD